MNICPKCKKQVASEFNFCPECGEDLKKQIACTQCGHIHKEISNFCHSCGNELAQKKNKKSKPTVVEYVIPTPKSEGITIDFPNNTAQSYEMAVLEAKKFPSYELFGNDKKCTHRVQFMPNEIITALELVNQMKGWRKRVVYVNGERVEWDTVFGFAWCHSRKSSCFKPEYYCYGYENEWDFNIWGCLHANLPFKLRDTYKYGRWGEKKGEWIFDLDRIMHELEKNLYQFRFCPSLNIEHIKNIITHFPKSVNPYENPDWDFCESYASQDGAISVISDNYGIRVEKYIIGVVPKGNGFIKEIQAKIQNTIPDFSK